jgi:hypothetical protein
MQVCVICHISALKNSIIVSNIWFMHKGGNKEGIQGTGSGTAGGIIAHLTIDISVIANLFPHTAKVALKDFSSCYSNK